MNSTNTIFLFAMLTFVSFSVWGAIPGTTNYADTIPRNVEWASLHDLTTTQFSRRFEAFRKRGWIIKDVDAYPDKDQTLYSMVWTENKDRRGWAEWRNLTSDGYHEKWEEYRKRGYRPTDIEGYWRDNRLQFAGIWEENREGLAWYSYRNLSSCKYGRIFRRLARRGFRLIEMEAYQTSRGIRYAAIWYENKEGLHWKQYRNMSRRTYQRRIDELSAEGYFVTDYESYKINGRQRYAAIWERNVQNLATAVRTNRTKLQFTNYYNRYRDLGYRLIDFERNETTNGSRYSGVWIENDSRYSWSVKEIIDRIITEYLDTTGVPGLSISIIKKGQRVYQRGFGLADVENNKEAHGGSVYLLASVSKVIGGTLAAKMESEQRLADGTTFKLDLSDPTRNYLPQLAPPHTHSVEQLLAHLGCIWHYDDNQPTPSGHFSTAEAALNEMQDSPLLTNCTIGRRRNYSTHAFTFIGAVLESVANRPIAQLVEEEIGQAYDLKSIKAQYRFSSLRTDSNRATPYNQSGNPTEYENNSWKVLGGGLEGNAIDVAQFGWLVADGQIVDPATRDNRLWRRVNPGRRNGLAWEIGTRNGKPFVEHGGGSANSARAWLRVYPDTEDELIIAVLSNQRGHNIDDLVDAVGDVILE